LRGATDTSNDYAWVITTCRKGGSRHSAPFPDIDRASPERTFTATRRRVARISEVWAGSGRSLRSRRYLARTAEADMPASTGAGTGTIDSRGGKPPEGSSAWRSQQNGTSGD